MQQKNVMILGTVTVVALGVAALALRNPDAAASKSEEARLFPALSEHINDVTEVRIEKGDKSTTLKREGGKWKLADRGGYPAQFEKVKELAVRIADLEIEEAKTSKKANHAKLGVEWPPAKKEAKEAKEGEATEAEGAEDAENESGLVTLRDASGKDLAAVVVGKAEWRGSKPKVYARRAGEDQVYLCAPRGTLSVTPDAKSYIDPKFVELSNDRVQSVAIDHADGEQVEIARSAENHTQFAIQNMPPGKSERYAGVANGVAQVLGYGLQLEDVRPVTEIDFNQSPLAKTRFRCVDGLELLFESAKFEDKTWVRVSASFTPPPEPPKTETPPAEGEDAAAKSDEEKEADEVKSAEEKPAEEKKEEKKDVGKEAAELNERLAPWAFEVASYKSDVLAKRMKDLLAEPPAANGEDGGLGEAMEDMGSDDLGQDKAEAKKSPDEDQSQPKDDDQDEDEEEDN
jgi:hypothetical protein